MASLLSEARSICPELMEAVKIMDKLAYSRRHAEVFTDLVDWLVWEHQFPDKGENPLAKKYSADEQKQFDQMYHAIKGEVEKRAMLYLPKGEKTSTSWYDPLGRMYECVTSKYKSTALGQFFTPKNVVDMMTQMTIGSVEQTGRVIHMLDPTSGSGRMGLAAATHAMLQGQPTWITMNDLDPICTKMTTANMCLNGIVGEALCSDGLDITGDTYKFGYRVEPMIAQVPEAMQPVYRMAMLAKTGQDIQKLYVAKPVAYERTFLKQANDHLLSKLEERQQIAQVEQREQAVQEVKDEIQERMKGTLFDSDMTQMENVGKAKKSSGAY